MGRGDVLPRRLAMLPKLRVLELRFCFGLLGRGVELVAAGCPALQVLGRARCQQLTDRALTALLRDCERLTHLNVRECATTAAGRAARPLYQLLFDKGRPPGERAASSEGVAGRGSPVF